MMQSHSIVDESCKAREKSEDNADSSRDTIQSPKAAIFSLLHLILFFLSSRMVSLLNSNIQTLYERTMVKKCISYFSNNRRLSLHILGSFLYNHSYKCCLVEHNRESNNTQWVEVKREAREREKNGITNYRRMLEWGMNQSQQWIMFTHSCTTSSTIPASGVEQLPTFNSAPLSYHSIELSIVRLSLFVA